MNSEPVTLCPPELIEQVRKSAEGRDVLLVSDSPEPSTLDWIHTVQSSHTALHTTDPCHPVGLILTPWVESSRQDAVIARLRDMRVKELWVIHPGDSAEQANRMGALGLHCRKMEQYGEQAWGLNYFSLRSYKKTPNWLNSRYWANPKMWGRFRW